jgi:hypothetical protein
LRAVSVMDASLAGRVARRVSLVLAATCALVLFVSAGSAAAQNYEVTYVARQCTSYTNIFANRARNNIQESLKDLGPDSPYPATGSFLVNPDTESLPPQDTCTPIVGWRFTLGTGIEGRAVEGPWGSLSKVTNPYDTVIETRDSVPLLNQNGAHIDNRTIAGAVTVPLTPDQVTQASRASALWVQGGLPDDPVMERTFPLPGGGPQYAFGALRCAVDALNGDNVEYIVFPDNVTHVFCYALYVTPPPTAGTITIEKRVTGAPAGENPSFRFNGSLSFDPNGFTLSNGQSANFPRAGGATWDVTERPVDGYALDSVQCSATTQGTGPATSTWTTTGASTSIDLKPEDHVTCVYNNRFVPPHGGLTIAKTTRGGTGNFGYVVSGGGESHPAHATTTEAGVPVNAEPSPLSLAPGTYTIRERRPASPDGTWRLVSVRCNGESVTSRPVRVEVHSGEGSQCLFVNVFRPRGSISLAKVTVGGTGTAKFVIDSHTVPPTQFIQHATTTEAGVPADAVPDSAADATDNLRLGSYTIVEQPPLSSPAGQWKLSSVICNDVVQPFDRGAITVHLTRSEPSIHCKFEDTFTATPGPVPPPVFPPPPPPPVNPPGGGASPEPVYPITDLSVTKRASASTVRVGHSVTYRLTVRNVTHVPAQRVVVTDQPIGRARILSVHNPAGTCRLHLRLVCKLGTLGPLAKVVLTVRTIPLVRGRHYVNRVAVGSGTQEVDLANNTAHATVRVLAPPAPPAGRG